MSHSEQEKFEYWKGRIIDRMKSIAGQLDIDLKKVLDDADHVHIVDAKLKEIVTKISTDFIDLWSAVAVAEPEKKKEAK